MPFGGINMANHALTSNGYEPKEELTHIFSRLEKTHNQGVFDAYTAEMRAARKTRSSLDFLTLTDVAASSVTTVVSQYTESTI